MFASKWRPEGLALKASKAPAEAILDVRSGMV
jgi:hypothetical protein